MSVGITGSSDRNSLIALLLTGWFTRRFGQLRLFIASVMFFTLTSFLCGFAHSMTELIIFRALQGFFAGPMFPMCQTLLLVIFPPMKRSMALALLSMVTVVAPIVGPITGGWLTDNYSWPWIFYINVPIGIFASIVVWSQLRMREETTQSSPVDYIGIALLVLGVGLLQVVLDKGNDEDWFSSTPIIVMSIVSAISLICFVIWELDERHPIVNLRLFKDRNTVGNIRHHRQIMGDQQHAMPRIRQGPEYIQNLFLYGGVQRGSRFIGNE